MKKKWMAALAMMLMATMLTACGGGGGGTQPANEAGGDAAGDEVIKIGGIAPLTGSVAIYGTANTNGAKMAFDEINEAGGIDGKLIEYNVLDDKGDETEATNAYNRLTSEGNVAVLGPVTTKPTLAVADLSAQDNFPMITATATGAAVTEAGDNAFRVCFTDPYQGQNLAVFAAETLNAEKVAILYNTSDDYSQGVAEAFENEAEAKGMTVVANEGYGTSEDTDFKAQLTTIAAQDPDVLLLPDYYKTVSLITAQARELGIEAVFLGGDGWDGVLSTISSADIVEGAYFSSHYSADDPDEKVQKFIENYKAIYNEEPNSFSALAYDTAYILAEAIKNADTMEPDAIVEALANTEFEGITGKIMFDEQGDPIKPVSIIKIVGGEYTLDNKVEAQS